jgi:nucleotidyltransferase/DNA polymerase involved in DNA repair
VTEAVPVPHDGGPVPPGPPGARPRDDTACTILHVDMDAFYASAEVRDRPELRGKPVVVAGLGARGVVLSATYEARAFGVRSAMPTTQARRLCPRATYISPRHGLYGEVSREVMAIFRAVTPEVEPLSLDEAFLDVSGSLRRLRMTPAEVAGHIREQVREQQAITCSVGVAPVKFVAKIASARCKPDGLLVVPADGVLDFLHPLPASALWGVGDKAEQALSRLGLRTIGDIAHIPEQALQRELGAAAGAHLWALAWGRDERKVVPQREEKSVGAEETFPVDVDDPEVIRRELLRLSDRTAKALRAAGCVARTVTVKLRLASFKTITRSRTLPEPTDVARVIYATACGLWEGSGLDARARLRLVGVRAAGLRPASGAATQLAFGDRPVGWREAERAVDQIVRRFGDGAVRPAALVNSVQDSGVVDSGAAPASGPRGGHGERASPAAPGPPATSEPAVAPGMAGAAARTHRPGPGPTVPAAGTARPAPGNGGPRSGGAGNDPFHGACGGSYPGK